MLRDFRTPESLDPRQIVHVKTKARVIDAVAEDYPARSLTGVVLPVVFDRQRYEIGGVTVDLEDRESSRTALCWFAEWKPEGTTAAALVYNGQLFAILVPRTLCRTLHHVAADGTVDWTADYFFDSPSNLSGNVGQCDVDADGNVYQCGTITQTLIGNSATPQVQSMYVLRSWDENAGLRWSWSESPLGVVSGSIRQAPRPLIGVRCGKNGDDPIVIVGDDDFNAAAQNAFDSTPKVNATALSVDGTQLWRVKIEQGARLVAAGNSRSLWRRAADVVGPLGWLLLDNATGAVTTTMGRPASWTVPTALEVHQTWVVCMTMDSDDVVYAVVSKRIVVGFAPAVDLFETRFAVARFPKDQTSPDLVVTSDNFSRQSFPIGSPCLKTLGGPRDIVVSGDRVVVASDRGIEVFNKADLQPLFHRCMPTANLWYANSDAIGMRDYGGNDFQAPSIHHADGSSWRVWDQPDVDDNGHPSTPTTFADARSLPGGGSIWSQNKTCVVMETVDDEREIDETCEEMCCQNCFAVSGITSPLTIETTGDDYPFSAALLRLLSFGTCKSQVCYWGSVNTDISPISGGRIVIVADTSGPGATMTVEVDDQIHTSFYPDGSVRTYYRASLGATLRCDDFRCDEGGSFTVQSGSVSVFYETLMPDGHSVRTAQFVEDLPFSALTVTPTDCGGVVDGRPSCTGVADFVSVSDGAGGFVWVADGADTCSLGCARRSPVTVPTAAGQHTSVGCA